LYETDWQLVVGVLGAQAPPVFPSEIRPESNRVSVRGEAGDHKPDSGAPLKKVFEVELTSKLVWTDPELLERVMLEISSVTLKVITTPVRVWPGKRAGFQS
jgi:hypothetical protein